ncbi:peptidoglycan-binding protein [Streptomyces sp. NPDC020875]|uniref:peptidoglycan-binding protein n=1 Tax=Streptomyces sp. NPDC020875 TaxID=3154898 RepID=UPI0034093D73
MALPVFEEYEPASDCDCPGCADRRRALAAGEHPAAHGCRRALVVVTAASAVLGAGAAAPVGALPHTVPGAAAATAEPDNEQGGPGALHGRPLPGPAGTPAVPVIPPTTRAEIIERAEKWVQAKVPYSMSKYWTDGYRQDCSGYVSMVWGLTTNEWTGSLAQFGTEIPREELRPGDILLFHNPSNPHSGSHVTIFGAWTDQTHAEYTAYEQTKPATRRQTTPMAYWNNSSKYVAYRYKGVTGATEPAEPTVPTTPTTPTTPTIPVPPTAPTTPVTSPGPAPADAFPGAGFFGPGAENEHVTRLGEMLVERGGARFYAEGPGPRWTEADRRATQAFQQAQGWSGTDADGIPGTQTWKLLVTGTGKDIPAPVSASTAAPAVPAAPAAATTPVAVPDSAPVPGPAATPGTASGAVTAVPLFPGVGAFRPGASGPYVTLLGERLVARGFGHHYTRGPGPVWSEADRRNVEAFQRAQGWRGTEADGYPGPETWRRLFAAPA